MIQDIYPHRFYNEYRPEAVLEADSPVLCYFAGNVLVKKGTQDPVYPQMRDLPEGMPDTVYAFCVDETEYFLDISQNVYDLEGFEYASIRDFRRLCDNVNGMIIFTGDHLYEWYSNSRFCGRCSCRTVKDAAERAMACPSCDNKIYPRLQPAVIVGVRDKDRLLVTKYKGSFNFYALVAGFSEIGETLEETVQREVMEETGLKVKNIRYYKSQPWGIAQDLLAGFYCDVDGSNIFHVDKNELKLAEWKSPDEIELQPDSFSLTNEMMRLFKERRI